MNKNQVDIDEHLLLQYLQGNANGELCASVEAWLKADSRNRKHLDQLESLWMETGKLTPAPVAVDVEAAWLRLSSLVMRYDETGQAGTTHHPEEKELNGSSHQRNEKTIRIRPYRTILRAAAMIILLIGIYGIYRWMSKQGKEVELVSGIGVIHDTLPDGSTVILNTNSKLTRLKSFNKDFREVTLTGEAFFEVKHDAAHPFIVRAGIASIRVLGTTFLVRAGGPCQGGGTLSGYRDPDRVVEVKVAEGRVMLFTIDPTSGDSAALILTSGETVGVQSGSSMPVKGGLTAPDDHFWANRTLEFRGTALSEVFMFLNKYYSTNVTVSDPNILSCRLTASFVNEPIDRILNIIAESFGLNLAMQGHDYHFTGHGCSKKIN